MATNFTGKIGEIDGIFRDGILKRIAISQFRIQKIKWPKFLCIVYKFGEILSSNPRVRSHNFSACRQKWAYITPNMLQYP